MSGVKITGMKAVMNSLSPQKLKEKTDKALLKFGVRVDRTAKELAPVDEGRLRSAIYYKHVDGGVEVGCAVDYAAYLEFGTGKFAAEYVATLPTEWKEFASQFKGSAGGNFREFVESIMGWVKRKGIDEDRAYGIALSILGNGIKPHPFIYPAVQRNINKLIEDLRK